MDSSEIGSRGLTPKQEAFVLAYVSTGNQCEAYRQAYDAEKMSQRAIEVEASRLGQHPAVTLRVAQLQERAAKRKEVTVDRIVQELAAVGFAPVDKTKIKPSDKNLALELLGKAQGLFIERTEAAVHVTHTLEALADLDPDQLAALAGEEVEGEFVAGEDSTSEIARSGARGQWWTDSPRAV